MPRSLQLNFKCNQCDAAYRQAELLETHINSKHLHITPFHCPKEGCDRSFAGKGNLRGHLKTHDKRFKCDREDCIYEAADKSDLDRHMYTHDGQKPFKCEFDGCDYSTAQPQNLKIHMLFHTDTRNFQCTQCDYRAHTKDVLEKHMRVHSHERPFACSFDGCDQSFATSTNLRQHELVHMDSHPCKCRVCGLHFRRAHHLSCHMEAYHSEKSRSFAHKEEKEIEDLLLKEGINFAREHHISYSCVSDRENNFARVDFLIQRRGGCILLEVDEKQHCNNEIVCENARMAKIHESLALEGNTLPLMFIRYNPHKYKVNGKNGDKTKLQRQSALFALIESVDLRAAQPMQVVYMFYDSIETDNVLPPQIFDNSEYDPELKLLCTQTIV